MISEGPFQPLPFGDGDSVTVAVFLLTLTPVLQHMYCVDSDINL